MKSIILLHGALGAKDQLEPLKEALFNLGYTVYSFSFSGHGEEVFQDEFSIQQFSKELRQFISDNNLKTPAVFGYSMGGYVALYLASQKKDLIGSIITLGTKFNWSVEIAQNEIKQLDPIIIAEKVPNFAAALKKRHGDSWELVLQQTADLMLGLGDNNLLNSKRFEKIENKVMIGLADKDSMVTAQETHRVIDQIINSQRYTLHNTKHPIETVDVSTLANIIDQFLQ